MFNKMNHVLKNWYPEKLITVKVTIIELNEIPSMNHLLKVISHDQQ